MTSPGPTLPPPGWHPDPSSRHELRYWDGTRWSEHVSDAGQVGTDDLASPAPVGTGVEPADTLASEPEPEPVASEPVASEPVASEPAAADVVPAVDLGAPPPSVPASAEGILDPAAAWGAPLAAPGAPPAMMRSIGGLAASLTVILWISVAAAAFGAFAFANRAMVSSDILDFDGGFAEAFDLQQRADDADSMVGAAIVVMLLCSLAIFVLLIIWMWRVAKNAELSGRVRPRFAPGWTIGGWFIPLANLVIPVIVMQDLWRASDPTVPRGAPDWRRASGSALVGCWWAAHILAAFRFGGGTEASSRDEFETLRVFDGLASFGMLAAIAAAILLILVVRRITRRQEALFAGPPITSG